ncbi:MAG: efflux RND transporter periplasmic adaptor subunit [Anaeromyxobacteraceae bacterium]
MTRRKLYTAAGTLVVAGLATALLSGGAKPPSFRTEAVKRGTLTVAVSATGTLQPTNQVDVGSELSGVVRAVEATYNQRVEQGQVLARLDPTKLEAQAAQNAAALASARAKVAQAGATVDEDRQQLARLEAVREKSGGKVPAQADLDAATAALARARADLAAAEAAAQQARAALDATRVDLTKAVVRSPVTGVVLKRSIEPGQTVAASLSAPVLFTVAEDLRRMELQVAVDEADVGRVKAGQEARFTVDAFPGRTFTARVAQVRLGATTSSGVVTYTTVLAVDNDDLALFPGMTATASIVVERAEGALLVPAAALRWSPPAPPGSGQGGATPGGPPGILGKLMPRPPGDAPPPAAQSGAPRIHVLRDGRPEPVEVTVGPTDGALTAVAAGGVAEGARVVVGTATGGSAP